MREFRYKALTVTGEMVAGIRRASDSGTLARQLFTQNLTLLESRATLGSLGEAFSFAGRAGRRELRDFTLHLATSLSAGIPVIAALRDFESDHRTGPFAAIIADLREEISSGAQIAEALARHPEVFSEVYVALAAAGQESGNLAECFRELVAYIEWNEDLRSQTRQAMIYPTILMVGVLGLFLLLILFVIPRFSVLFGGQSFELPAVTRRVLATGEFFGRWWSFLLGLLAVLALGGHLLRRTAQGRYALDLAWLRIPVVGDFAHKLALSRFARHFAMLFGSGTNLLQVLTLLQKVVANAVLERELALVHDHVTSGETLAASFAKTLWFPPLIQRLIAVGEKTGRLDETVLKAAEYLDKEIPRALKQSFMVLEVVIIAVLGALIALFALALLLPILELRSQLV